MAERRAHSVTEIEDAIRENHGIILSAARKLGITRQGIEKRIKANARLQQAVTEARGDLVDTAEAALFVALTNREAWAVQFTLRTLGRTRGYGEKVDVTIVTEEVIKQAAEDRGLDASEVASLAEQIANGKA